jgi:tetratricopeptide (TPR) repeat protein
MKPCAFVCRAAAAALLVFAALSPASAAPPDLTSPPVALEGLRLLYSGDPDAAIEKFAELEQQQPDHPLGYLLEAEARWWKIVCLSAEFKWGMTDTWRREKLPEDAAYLKLADKSISLAEAQLKQSDSAEMRFYAGMGYALKARLYGLRDEKRATARAGVRAREHLLRALALDPSLVDACTGVGLYNYYVDTLSAIAKFLRFFMGIPGGSKREGIRLLEKAMTEGVITPAEARFYLARNLRNYDRDYERALGILTPLVEQYPANPLFQLAMGDLNAKLNRKEKAAAYYRAAAALPVRDPACRASIERLVRESLAALGPGFVPAN